MSNQQQIKKDEEDKWPISIWPQKYIAFKTQYLLEVRGTIKKKKKKKNLQRDLNFKVKWTVVNLNPKHLFCFLLSCFGKTPECGLALDRMSYAEIPSERNLAPEAQIPSKAKQFTQRAKSEKPSIVASQPPA